MVRLRSFAALVTVGWIAAGGGAASARPQGATPSEPPQSTLDVRVSLDTYCVRCHSTRLRTAGLSLEGLDVQSAPAHAEVWEKVAAKLRSGAMPPPGNPRPDAKTAAALATSVERVLDEAAETSPVPGRPAIHRLNRAEYTNVVRDLLAIDVDSRSLLPADDLSFGFDNNADALTFSPGLMDRYLLAARKIARLAVGDLSTRPVVESFPVSRLLSQSDRASEDLPFGTRGGLSIKHQFPVDGEYVLRVRLQGSLATSTDDRIDVRLDGEQLRLFETAKARRDRQAIDTGLPDPPLEVRFAAKAGPHRIGVAVVKRTSMAEGTAPSRLPVGNITFRAPGIAAVDLEGPFNVTGVGETPSRRRIFTCRPARPSEERTCAARILGGLARQAYRRPVGEPDIRTLLTFFESRRPGGFDAGIGAALERILIDPEFLFRVERAPRGQAAGVPVPSERPGPGIAPLVLPLEQHAGCRIAHGGGAGNPARSGEARGAGAPHARGRARVGAGREFRGPVAPRAQPARGGTGCQRIPRVRR